MFSFFHFYTLFAFYRLSHPTPESPITEDVLVRLFYLLFSIVKDIVELIELLEVLLN